jgi:glycosyltransferase involved in cell wall biosynthesis
MEITVIVPTYNRLVSLKDTVQALQTQTLSRHLYEVIIVNDGSSDGTEKFLQQMVEKEPSFRFFTQANGGPAAARNRGVAEAQGRIIAFTDDDCIPQADWLEVILSAFVEPGTIGLQGSTYTDVKDITPLTHQIDNENGNASVPTCNAAFTREALLRVKGFDEQFPFPHNEDADLAWRIEEFGKILFIKAMRVYHPPRTDVFQKVARRMKIMESEFRLYYRNPRAYQHKRASSPWKNIYWEIGVKTLGYYLVSRWKYYQRPWLMIQGIGLIFIWWADLILRYPRFLKCQRKEEQNSQLA